MNKRKGALTVVGTGIKFANHLTLETRSVLQGAEKVLFLVADPATRAYIRELNDSAEDLHPLYKVDKPRRQSYLEMVERVMSFVRRGQHVCFALYGHPGVFSYPPHRAIREARAEGFPARMLPAVSAEDCLFADLGVDPATCGCQSYEASDFLVFRRRFDPRCALILWQIACIGELGYVEKPCNRENLRILVEYLSEHYERDHEVVVYEGSQFSVCDPRVHRVPLGQLAGSAVTQASTLYLPPARPSVPDQEMLTRLGLAQTEVARRGGGKAAERNEG